MSAKARSSSSRSLFASPSDPYAVPKFAKVIATSTVISFAKHAQVRQTLDALNCTVDDELQMSFFSSPPGRPPGRGGRGGRKRRTQRNDLEAVFSE